MRGEISATEVVRMLSIPENKQPRGGRRATLIAGEYCALIQALVDQARADQSIARPTETE